MKRYTIILPLEHLMVNILILSIIRNHLETIIPVSLTAIQVYVLVCFLLTVFYAYQLLQRFYIILH